MRKYVLLLLVFLLLVAGLWVGQNVDKLKILYRKHFSDEFFINPLVELVETENYVITLWSFRLPGGGSNDMEIQLEDSLQEFRRLYPNIEVSYRLLDVLEGEQLLQQALAEGNPPDLYCSLFEPFGYFGSLQVPVDLYLEDDSAYYPVAADNFRFGKHLWAWPLTVMPEFYVSNDISLSHDLNWAQIAGSGEGSSFTAADTSTEGFYLHYSDPHKLAVLDNKAADQWLADVNHIGQAYRNGMIVHAPADGLARFLQQEVDMIGPLTPWSYTAVRELARFETAVHFLSPLRANSAGIVMFRQTEYKGHQHTKAAALLAQFLAQKQPQVLFPLDLFCSPAYRPLSEDWLQILDLAAEEKASYLNALTSGQPVRVYDAQQWEQRQQFVKRIAAPLWGQFINGKLTAEELLQQLQQEAKSFLER